MDKILTALLFIFIFSSTQAAPIIKDFGHTQVIMGSSTAEFLNALYNRQFPNCHNSDSMPAFLCSGVVLRVTTKDPAGTYKVWDPSPTSQATGGAFRFLIYERIPIPEYWLGVTLMVIFFTLRSALRLEKSSWNIYVPTRWTRMVGVEA